MTALFRPTSPRQLDLALLVLRLAIGAIFIAHGGQKLFVYGFDGVAGAFGQMGIPMAAIAGPLVALTEFIGGIALVAGLLTRLAALGLGVTMLVALLLVHLPAGFFLPNGIEFVLALLAATVALTLTGAGSLSADAAIARRTAPRRVDPAVPKPAARHAA